MEPPTFTPGEPRVFRTTAGNIHIELPPPAGTPPFQYEWRHAGATLDDRFSTSQDSRGVRLTISAATTDDSGVYTLQASNAAGTDTTRVRLEVSPDDMASGDDPPTFLRRLHDLTVKVGTRTRFLVEIISSSECRVTWYRNERRLLEAERIALVRDGNFWCADIAAVSVDDAGRWTCTAENNGGRASCSAHLNVLVPKAYKRPEFVEELRALLTEQGTVSLECKVVGIPTPVLRWFKDSREIKAGDVFALTANAEDPTSLGTYTCEAVNCMGRAYSSSKVHVVGHGSKESLRPSSGGAQEPPPIFTKELEDHFVRICEPLNLGCHIVVPPWPRAVVWYNKEGKIEPSERYHVLEDGVGGYMIEVPSAEYRDEGEWKCVATSAGGRVGISTCYVSMEVPKNYRKPRFMENLQAILTEEGLVTFECKVVGFPTPVLSWFKDGQELKPGDVYQLTGTNSLGSYCCIARNCMGQASSSAELSVEDIQNQLNEEEKLQLFTRNQAPKFLQGLKSIEAKIDETFRFTVKVAIPPEPSVLWYRDDQPVDETSRCHLGKEDRGVFFLDIQNLELLDQAEWKCVAMNDYGHSVTSCFLKLIIPRHYKKPRFLENLQAILSDEGAVNLECKVIGVPQPVLKWYKDGEELKPGDIHRIISGQDGKCCLGTYTCEAHNCMGIAASSASLSGFEDSTKNSKKKSEDQALQRNLSLSTIHEERTSQMYDTPVGDITLDDKGEISFSFDGKEVSVSLYETPDLTEEEALQIIEMYADQLSENVTEHNVVELPPLRFVKETSTSGNLLMEAIIIDVSPDRFITSDEDLRTEADIDDISIADENAAAQLSLDRETSVEDYLEKTMALLSDEKADFPKKSARKKSDSQKSIEDYYSLSRDQSISEEKKEDDTQPLTESFASAHSLDKAKSKSSKPSLEEGLVSSDITKTVLLKEEIIPSQKDTTKGRRRTFSSRRSSSGSDKSSTGKSKEKVFGNIERKMIESDSELNPVLNNIITSLKNVINDVQFIEKDIIVRSQLMSSTSAASRSLEIIKSIIMPLNDILCVINTTTETLSDVKLDDKSLNNTFPIAMESLLQSLTVLEKCIEVESENKTLVQKTCILLLKKCGEQMSNSMELIKQLVTNKLIKVEEICLSNVTTHANKIKQTISHAIQTIENNEIIIESKEGKVVENIELKHLNETQKALHELRIPLKILSYIIENSFITDITNLYGISYCDVILNNMSTSIQDLQNALEYVDNLALKESSTNLQKYNTEIIDGVMNSVLKLRTSFEQLSAVTSGSKGNNILHEIFSELKLNLDDISTHLDKMEKRIGTFDVVTNENKLEVLQKVAQILICLEHNLLLLDRMPEVQKSLTIFHSTLTKVLENVIESNNVKKYFTLMEVSALVNRVNASLKNIDPDNKLCFVGIIDALQIIQANVKNNIFTHELNNMLIKDISETIISIQNTLNKAEFSICPQDKTEQTDDIVTDTVGESKAIIISEPIEKVVAAINNIISLESTTDLILRQALENIIPVLVNFKISVAALQLNQSESEQILQLPDLANESSIAKPLYDLQENVSVLSQMITENVDSFTSDEHIKSFAESLLELNSALEILQQDANSQIRENVDIKEVSTGLANIVQSIRSCILIIREHAGIEVADDLSTLEDISGIKTIAEFLPIDNLILPSREENMISQSVETLTSVENPTKQIAIELHKLNEHIMVVQNPQIVEVLDSLSEDDEYASLKSVIPSLKDLHQCIGGNIPPVLFESCEELTDTINTQNIINFIQPLKNLQQCLCVVDANKILVCESVTQIPAEQINMAMLSILELKGILENCLSLLLPASRVADETVDILKEVYILREKIQNILQILEADLIPSESLQNLKLLFEEFLLETNTTVDAVKLRNLIEKLCGDSNKFEDKILGYASSDTFLAKEVEIIQTLQQVEKNIAVLEQHGFVDFSQVADIDCHLLPIKAMLTETDSLKQAENITENIVHVIEDSTNTVPKEDIQIKGFFKKIKNNILLLNCLIQKRPTHKRIIRLIQEFFLLNKEIKEFEFNLENQALSNDTKVCAAKFLSHTQELLATIRPLLLNVINTDNNILIGIPLSNINSSFELYNNILSSYEYVYIHELLNMLISLSNLIMPLLTDLHLSITNEINTIAENKFESDAEVSKKIFEIKTDITNKIQATHLDEVPKKIFESLLAVIEEYEDYEKATDIGKKLIISKFLSECFNILHDNCVPEHKRILKVNLKEKTLKDILFEMKKPFDDLHSELINLQEQVSYKVDQDDTISLDISSSESCIQVLSQINEVIESHLNNQDLKINDDDISLVRELDEELHSIEANLLSLENVNAVEDILIPINEIGKSLDSILSANTEPKHDQSILHTEHTIVESFDANVTSEEVKSMDEAVKVDDLELFKHDEFENIEIVPEIELFTETLEEQKAEYKRTTEADKIDESVQATKATKHVGPDGTAVIKCEVEEQDQKPSTIQILLRHIQQYVDEIEHTKEDLVILNIRLEDLERAQNTAKQLCDTITISEVVSIDSLSETIIPNITPDQAVLVQELKQALESIKIQFFSKEEDLKHADKIETYQRVIETIDQLRNDLVTITDRPILEDVGMGNTFAEIKSAKELEKEDDTLEQSKYDESVKTEYVSETVTEHPIIEDIGVSSNFEEIKSMDEAEKDKDNTLKLSKFEENVETEAEIAYQHPEKEQRKEMERTGQPEYTDELIQESKTTEVVASDSTSDLEPVVEEQDRKSSIIVEWP